jgi:hypothetical protein
MIRRRRFLDDNQAVTSGGSRSWVRIWRYSLMRSARSRLDLAILVLGNPSMGPFAAGTFVVESTGLMAIASIRGRSRFRSLDNLGITFLVRISI